MGSLTVEHIPVHILNTRLFAEVFDGMQLLLHELTTSLDVV
ncbi:MAG: hypothetical protein ACFE0Q_16570 [Anaerolineae bacterium]